MDKPKESKVRTRVMEILRNHDQEARVIEAQIAAEKEALEADLEFILESAYPSSQLSDAGVRVQSSPDPDGRLVRMVDKRDRRRQRANEAIGNLERQLQQITEVQNLVYTLDTRSKCVLLALYYPYRSYDEAAEFLQVERTTVYRQREIALNRLFARAERSKAFREYKFMQLCATVCNYLQLYATVNGKNIWYNIIVDLRVHPPIDIGYRKTFLRERLFCTRIQRKYRKSERKV